MFKKLFSDKKRRQEWEAGLAWFRLRYLEPPTRCLNLLSRSAACGRIALYFRPGETVSELYLGLARTHTRLLGRMAADFGFSLKPRPPEVVIPAVQPMTAVTDLPWDRPFAAHITNEFAFVSSENGGGSYLPQPPAAGPRRGAWTLPANPPAGLTLRPSWNSDQPPARLRKTDGSRWPLGRTAAGVALGVDGRINLYGRQEAAADWLVAQVTQVVAFDPTNLVVIDGAGDLVPRLKRKAAMTRLLGKQLAYVDLEGEPLNGGFNPLAAVLGETETETVVRWQKWFAGMNVQPQGLHLLAQARQDGVGDILTLGKWLKQAERHGPQAAASAQAVTSLSMALNRLAADHTLRDWLAWPANQFEILPERALFFRCKNLGWGRQQLLRSVLLAVMQVKGVRLVLHGFPWGTVDIAAQEAIALSNGPHLTGSTVVLAACHAPGAAALAGRFLNGDVALQETLELLPSGEGLVVTEEGVVLAGFSQGKPALKLKKNGQLRGSTTILDK